MGKEDSLISPGEVSELLRNSLKLAGGLDSEVYVTKDGLILKRYSELDLEEVKLYQQVTKEAAQIVDGTTLATAAFGELTVSISQIRQVIESAENFDVVTVSKAIGGVNPNDLLRHKELTQADFNDLEAKLNDLSVTIMERAPYTGIHIIPWNTKVVTAENEKLLIVTDVCKKVMELKIK